jgi:exosome complex component CSL4
VEVCSGKEQTCVPSAGDIVTARITQVNPRWGKCLILCVNDIVLAEPFRGILRKEDVRATEKDRVEMYKCFRPTDIILARVVRKIL